jgi:molybdate transport system substrate-binding protein
MTRSVTPLASVMLLLAGGCRRDPRGATERPPVRVAAAADLSVAFEELGRRFARQTGRRVVFSFGSTGMLARQLREGAPFDVFAAANVSFVDEVVAAGVCDGSTRRPYARGRIAVWTKRGGVAPPASLADLAHPRFRRLAIANPAHAPYGLAARQALTRAGLWGAVERRLVLGENVRQALQYAQTGNVDATVIALSLVVNDRENPWFVVDEGLHSPIVQALAVCVRGADREGGGEFARFVNADEGRAVMRRHGFLLPGEQRVQAP